MILQPWTQGITTGLFVVYTELFPRPRWTAGTFRVCEGWDLCVRAMDVLSLFLQKAAETEI